jgi:hypothetical protein
MGLDIMKLEKLKRLGILINTADAPPGPLDIDNATGVSTQMLVNHLGPMLFTITLLPLLKTTDKANNTPVDKKDVRIVYVNSTAFSMLHSTVNLKTIPITTRRSPMTRTAKSTSVMHIRSSPTCSFACGCSSYSRVEKDPSLSPVHVPEQWLQLGQKIRSQAMSL